VSERFIMTNDRYPCMPKRCSKCKREAVVSQPYSGLDLCPKHFAIDLERKVKREIRRHRWLSEEKRIGVAVSGSACSCTLLHLLAAITRERRDITLFCLHVNDGTMDKSSLVKEIAEIEGVGLVMGWAGTQPETRQTEDITGEQLNRWRRNHIRNCLIRMAEREKITMVALGSTLDDEAESILAGFLSGEISCILEPDGLQTIGSQYQVSWIRPLRMVPRDEGNLYAEQTYPGTRFPRSHYGDASRTGLAAHPESSGDSRRERCQDHDRNAMIQKILSDYTSRHPSALYSIVNLGEAIRSAYEHTDQYREN